MLGCVALGFGGLWAIDVSQSNESHPALNGASATMYIGIVVLYGTVAWAARTWRAPHEHIAARTAGAAVEALVVGLLAAPVFVAGVATYSCLALEGCS